MKLVRTCMLKSRSRKFPSTAVVELSQVTMSSDTDS